MSDDRIRDSGPWAKVPVAVLAFELTVHEWRCYVGLARYADDAGRCWPKQKTVAQALGVSRWRARQLLESLEAKGLIAKDPRVRPNGGKSSNVYLLGPFDGSDSRTNPAIDGSALSTNAATELRDDPADRDAMAADHAPGPPSDGSGPSTIPAHAMAAGRAGEPPGTDQVELTIRTDQSAIDEIDGEAQDRIDKYLGRLGDTSAVWRRVSAVDVVELGADFGLTPLQVGSLLGDVWEWWRTMPPSRRWPKPMLGIRRWLRRDATALVENAVESPTLPRPPAGCIVPGCTALVWKGEGCADHFGTALYDELWIARAEGRQPDLAGGAP